LAQSYPALHQLNECAERQHFDLSQWKVGYCLPLFNNVTAVGLLHFYTSAQKYLDAEQKMMLENISMPVAVYLEIANEKKAREEDVITQKTRAVQLEIARDLHDTIGQNISYLRMKLDLLSETDLHSKTDIEAEIRQMCEVANESYDLVRGTLAVLQSGGSADLLRLFSRYGEQVAERSTFEIHFSGQGAPRSLSPQQMRQLFYIYREALSNIEKHANASQACIEMIWEADGLTLVITDNGRGFDPTQIQYGSHYGLRFLRDRAESIGGSLSIHSSPGAGTNIVMHAPCCE
jgi:signal transduction histidine kinase